MSEDSNRADLSLDPKRREYLKQAGLIGFAGAAIGLSGCSSGGSGDGEQVAVELSYWTAAAYETQIQQDTLDVIRGDLEALGMDVTIQGYDIPTSVSIAYEDQRNNMYSGTMWAHGPDPSRIDPDEFASRMGIDKAGPDGSGNVANYASCEYTKWGNGQRQAATTDQRREWVNQAQQILSEDKAVIPIGAALAFGATTDNVNADSVGKIGITPINPDFFMDSTPKSGGRLLADIRSHVIEDLNPLTTGDVGVWIPFMRMFWSPLVAYNTDLELEPILIKEIPEFEDDGKKLTLELRDGLSFHNGDPIASEDVKWTFEWAQENADTFPSGGGDPGFDSVNVVDDTTVEVTFPAPSLPFLSVWLTRWGILHKESLEAAGAVSNPADWRPNPNEMIGSGPYTIDTFQSAQTLAFSPSGVNHPIRNPAHDIVFQGFDDATAVTQAIISGELDVAVNISGGNIDTINSQGGGSITTYATPGHGPFLLYPQCHVAPFKFPAMRDAVGTAIDRQSINEIAFNGENEMETRPTLFNKQHPWRAPDDMLYNMTDDLTGDVEGAKQKLRDAGFTYDGDTLLYPEDADLDPLWPAGEFPSAENGFECANAEGEYTGELP